MLATLGWAVVHALWQWTLIAGVTACVLALLSRRSARVRYGVGLGALLCMAAVFVFSVATADSRQPSWLRQYALYSFDSALAFDTIIANGQTILRVAGGVWLGFVAWQLTRLAHAWQRAHRLSRDAHRAVDGTTEVVARRVARHLGVAGPVAVRLSTLATVPMLLGARTPTILLPREVAARLSAEQLRAVLAHELAHVARRDVAVNAVQLLIDVCAAFHPCARWVSRAVRNEREYCCDDLAAAVAGGAAVYARALAALEDARSGSELAVAAVSGTLLDRVRRIVGRSEPRLSVFRGVGLLAGALIISTVLLILAMNVAPPWVPSGVRLRRPPPSGASLSLPASLPGPPAR